MEHAVLSSFQVGLNLGFDVKVANSGSFGCGPILTTVCLRVWAHAVGPAGWMFRNNGLAVTLPINLRAASQPITLNLSIWEMDSQPLEGRMTPNNAPIPYHSRHHWCGEGWEHPTQ
jgi:hypothetical protein